MATVEEELSEREVLWPEARHGALASALGFSSSSSSPSPRASRSHLLPSSAGSRPVDIPRAARLPRGRADLAIDDGEEEEADDGCGAMVPPHLMVSRRRSDGEAAVAFSLRSGPGRARRDLSHLRHSVLRRRPRGCLMAVVVTVERFGQPVRARAAVAPRPSPPSAPTEPKATDAASSCATRPPAPGALVLDPELHAAVEGAGPHQGRRLRLDGAREDAHPPLMAVVVAVERVGQPMRARAAVAPRLSPPSAPTEPKAADASSMEVGLLE